MRPRQFDTHQVGDAELLAGCLAGDQHAWNTLVHRYSRLVLSIARSSGLGDADAADVVQNVFTIVLRRLESLQDPERFASWLMTTTRRESWRYRKSLRDVTLEDGVDMVDPALDAEGQVVAWETASLTQRALDRLGDRCRRLLTALFLQDDRPGYTELSEDLGIAVGSIGPIRARCLKQLRAHLADLGVVDSPS